MRRSRVELDFTGHECLLLGISVINVLYYVCHTEHILFENSVIVSTNRMWSSISHLADKCSDISINTHKEC